jgi:hypothetical protein
MNMKFLKTIGQLQNNDSMSSMDKLHHELSIVVQLACNLGVRGKRKPLLSSSGPAAKR